MTRYVNGTRVLEVSPDGLLRDFRRAPRSGFPGIERELPYIDHMLSVPVDSPELQRQLKEMIETETFRQLMNSHRD